MQIKDLSGNLNDNQKIVKYTRQILSCSQSFFFFAILLNNKNKFNILKLFVVTWWYIDMFLIYNVTIICAMSLEKLKDKIYILLDIDRLWSIKVFRKVLNFKQCNRFNTINFNRQDCCSKNWKKKLFTVRCSCTIGILVI